MNKINILNNDCLEVLKTYKANAFDLVITDPPFGIGNFVQQTGNTRGEQVEWNEQKPAVEIFTEIERISKHQIIFGANYFNCFSIKGGAIVWVKNQPMPDFSKAVIASCSYHKKIELYTQTWTNFVAKNRETKHPCEMPVDLFRWIFKKYINGPAKILDPFMGSGSSAIAAANFENIEYTGIEKNINYFIEAENRIEKHHQQTRIFYE